MVLDTSALLAILLKEPEAPAFAEAIAADPVRLLSAASLVRERGDGSCGRLRRAVT